MNKEHVKALLPVITAFANGEGIEVDHALDGWKTIDEPTFTANPKKYRIKPKPREGWCHKDSFEECPISPDMTSEDWIKVREVME